MTNRGPQIVHEHLRVTAFLARAQQTYESQAFPPRRREQREQGPALSFGCDVRSRVGVAAMDADFGHPAGRDGVHLNRAYFASFRPDSQKLPRMPPTSRSPFLAQQRPLVAQHRAFVPVQSSAGRGRESQRVLSRQVSWRFPALSFSSQHDESARQPSDTSVLHRTYCLLIQSSEPVRTPPWRLAFSKKDL
jgi:hypothetical protein